MRARLDPAKHLLVVEDDADLREALRKLLEDTGYRVSTYADGRGAAEALERESFDLAIIDLLLPDMHGLTLVRMARQSQGRVPIVIVTARAALEDRIAGLDSGADDYVVKPFQMRELEARIRALLRHPTDPPAARDIRFGRLQWTPGQPRVLLDGTAVELPRGEFMLLEALATRPGHPVSKETIGAKLPNSRGKPTAAAIELCVYRLRRRLAPYGLHIRSLRGFGYLLLTDDAKG